MTFVLDASVTMCWLLLDGKPPERAAGIAIQTARASGLIAATSSTRFL